MSFVLGSTFPKNTPKTQNHIFSAKYFSFLVPQSSNSTNNFFDFLLRILIVHSTNFANYLYEGFSIFFVKRSDFSISKITSLDKIFLELLELPTLQKIV